MREDSTRLPGHDKERRQDFAVAIRVLAAVARHRERIERHETGQVCGAHLFQQSPLAGLDVDAVDPGGDFGTGVHEQLATIRAPADDGGRRIIGGQTRRRLRSAARRRIPSPLPFTVYRENGLAVRRNRRGDHTFLQQWCRLSAGDVLAIGANQVCQPHCRSPGASFHPETTERCDIP